MFNPPPSVADLSSLFSLGRPRHYRRSNRVFVMRHGRSPSTFLRPLAPRALPRFVATTDALTPAGRFFGPCGHEPRSVPGGSPCLARTHVQPFCSQPLHRLSPGISVRSRFLSARGCQPADPLALRREREFFPCRSWPGLRNSARRLAGRCSRIGFTLCWSRRYGRVVHLRRLSTPRCHGAVAFGYRRVNVPPDGDFHPAVCTISQAHERGVHAASRTKSQQCRVSIECTFQCGCGSGVNAALRPAFSALVTDATFSMESFWLREDPAGAAGPSASKQQQRPVEGRGTRTLAELNADGPAHAASSQGTRFHARRRSRIPRALGDTFP